MKKYGSAFIEGTIDMMNERIAMWHEFMETVNATLEYEKAHPQEAPKFFCGQCNDVLYFNEFLRRC